MIRVASNGKIDENRARPREGSVAISKTGDNPAVLTVDRPEGDSVYFSILTLLSSSERGLTPEDSAGF